MRHIVQRFQSRFKSRPARKAHQYTVAQTSPIPAYSSTQKISSTHAQPCEKFSVLHNDTPPVAARIDLVIAPTAQVKPLRAAASMPKMLESGQAWALRDGVSALDSHLTFLVIRPINQGSRTSRCTIKIYVKSLVAPINTKPPVESQTKKAHRSEPFPRVPFG